MDGESATRKKFILNGVRVWVWKTTSNLSARETIRGGTGFVQTGTKVYAQVSVSGKPSLGIYPKNSNSSLSFNLIRWYCLDGSLRQLVEINAPKVMGADIL